MTGVGKPSSSRSGQRRHLPRLLQEDWSQPTSGPRRRQPGRSVRKAY